MFSTIQGIIAVLTTVDDKLTRKHLAMALRRAVLVATQGDIEPPPTPKAKKSVLTQEEISAGQRIGKLDAVKMFKVRTGTSLMDAKKVVEAEFSKLGLSFHNNYQPLPSIG